MNIKLNDSEMVIMDVLWREGDLKATHIADIAKEKVNWEKNTAYTVIQRLIKKGHIERSEPGFICHPTVGCDDVRKSESKSLVDRLCGGSLNVFVKSFLDENKISEEELEKLRNLINKG